MDEPFQFIIESPQNTQGHKKRPRLVTSCDNCRLKKIKCLQPSPESKCEACKSAKIQCRFRDRERYFAERSRAIAGPAAQPYGEDRSETGSSLDYSPTGVVSPVDDPGSRYPGYSSDPRRSTDSHRHTGTLSASPYYNTGYNYASSTPSPLGQNRPVSRAQIQLFDPERQQMPHPSLMHHFIQLFFDQLGRDLTFLSYDDITAQHWDQRLPPPVANCIAALAARFSTLPELTVRGLHNVTEAYAENARALMNAMGHISSLENLYAYMLLSWFDYRYNRLSDARTYYQLAMRMGMDLGLQDERVIAMIPSEAERNRRRAAWNGVVQLHWMLHQEDHR